MFTYFDEGYYNSSTNISIVYDILKFQKERIITNGIQK